MIGKQVTASCDKKVHNDTPTTKAHNNQNNNHCFDTGLFMLWVNIFLNLRLWRGKAHNRAHFTVHYEIQTLNLSFD